MTVRVDYTTLDQPGIRLTLHPVPGGYTVRDQHGADYVLAPCTFAFAARFLYAMREKRDALINEDSVLRWYRHERWQQEKSSGPVPMAERDGRTSPVPQSVASGEVATGPDDFSVRVPDNVYPLWGAS